MNIAVLGTGMVGNTIGTKLVHGGHKVKMGSRTAANEKAAAWVTSNGANASQGTFDEAAKFAEVVINCTSGIGAIDALTAAGKENLNGKIIIDISNPLDFSKGMPPSLTICNTDSLGELIQRTFPEAKVVKTLNTLTCLLMVNPLLVPGDHNIFVSGNDASAKSAVKNYLHDWFGWKGENIIDLGDITTARGTEQLLPIWVRLYGLFQNPIFNFKIVIGPAPKM
ncbi:MAG: NAD(P)-binding domain-containing protein [Bacteroidota bacterium]|nr:NAD(P)-binding domain-containing protein [Bacteroidota bacterium]